MPSPPPSPRNLLLALLLPAVVLVPALAGAAASVIAAEVVERPFPIAIEGLGTARANEAIELRPQITEVVHAIHFEEGRQVRKGAVLVELDDAEAQAGVALARAELVESDGRYRRALELFETRAVSVSDLEQREARRDADRARLSAAQSRLADTRLRAPFSGRVGLRRVSPGSLVGPDTVITTLDDTDPIKLDFAVPETSLSLLERGLPVSARSAAWPDEKFEGKIDSIDTRVDPVSRTVRVRARIPNPDGRLRAGMFLSVLVEREDVRALMIPEQALVPEQSLQYVFVIDANDRIEKREIRIGRRRPGEVEVLDGLVAGERVVAEGTQKARDGEIVRVIETQLPHVATGP